MWELGYKDGIYMQFDTTSNRYQLNDETKSLLEGYKKLEQPRTITREKILDLLKSYYIVNGHFVSGSIDTYNLEWYFPELHWHAITKLMYELYQEHKLCYTSTIGGGSYYLPGNIRVQLIEAQGLIEKWKTAINGRAPWMHSYEEEYEAAKKDCRCYGYELQK
jgi:hypothetical protein